MALFSKFEGGTAGGSAGAAPLARIIQNLNNVLNTRKGFGSPLRDFGIRDLNEYTSGEQIALAVMAEVKRNIEAYEPSLEEVTIAREESAGPFKLAFRLDCRIREDARSLRMVFDTVINSIRVEGG